MSRDFDGVDDMINMGSGPNVDNEEPFTLAAWIKPRSPGESNIGAIFHKGVTAGSSGMWRVRMTTTNAIQFEKDYTGGGNVNASKITSDGVAPNNIWSFITVTWDGNPTVDGGLRFYVNGVEVAATGNDGVGTKGSDAAQDLVIGNNTGGSATFRGLIAHAQGYRGILTADQIRSIMFMPGSLPGLFFYLPLYGDADPEPDLSGFMNTGVVTGTTKGEEPPVARMFRVKRRFHTLPSVAFQGLTETSNIIGSRIFNGTTDQVSCASTPAIDSFQIYSACAWIKIRTMPVASTGTICAKKDGALNGWQFYVDNSNNRIGLSVGFAGTDGVFTTGNNSITVGDWYHVAFCYDATDLLSAPQMYINGIAQVISSTLPTVGILDDSGAPFTIGAWNSGNFLNASIGRVLYFDRFLTRGEVVQSMVMPGSVSGAKLFIPMFGVSSPEPDFAGHKINGTVSGTFPYSGAPVSRHMRLNRRGGSYYKQSSGAQAYAVDLVLAMTLTNSLSKDFLRPIIDALTLSENKSLNTLKALTESWTIAHPVFSPSKDFLKVLSQQISVTETISKDTLKYISDSLSLTESNSKDYIKAIAQSLTLTESQAKDVLRVLNQSITLTETQYKDILKVITQTMTVTESNDFRFIIAAIITFLLRGHIEPHDKVSMEHDLSTTALSSQDRFGMIKDLHTTALSKSSDNDMDTDQDMLLWDWHDN